MSDELLPKTERRNLRYDFTAKETHDLSLELASATKKLAAIEEEKSSVTSQYGAKIKEAKATCNKLSNLVADGYEIREVECEVIFHQPQQGKKTIIRKDSGKVTAIEAMTDWEWNLFNQPPDEEADENVGTKKGRKKGNKGSISKGRKKKNLDVQDVDYEEVKEDDAAEIPQLPAPGDQLLDNEDSVEEMEGADDFNFNEDNEDENQD